MLVTFSPIFVVDTKIIFVYNFVAPLRFIKLRFSCEIELILLQYVNIMTTSEENIVFAIFHKMKKTQFFKTGCHKQLNYCIYLESLGLSFTLLFIPDNLDSQTLTFQKKFLLASVKALQI